MGDDGERETAVALAFVLGAALVSAVSWLTRHQSDNTLNAVIAVSTALQAVAVSAGLGYAAIEVRSRRTDRKQALADRAIDHAQAMRACVDDLLYDFSALMASDATGIDVDFEHRCEKRLWEARLEERRLSLALRALRFDSSRFNAAVFGLSSVQEAMLLKTTDCYRCVVGDLAELSAALQGLCQRISDAAG